jgi:hypothetical protein
MLSRMLRVPAALCLGCLACAQDPDAPSPDAPKYRFWLHWLVINIPGVDVHRGEVVTPYMGPVRKAPQHLAAQILTSST